jgi:HlyD family secretion protein/adhesin transport system membrane fusion protein
MKVQRMNMVREIENLEEATLNERYALIRLEKALIDSRQSRNSEYQSQITDTNKILGVKQTQLPTIRDKVERLLVFSPVDGTVDKVHYNYISAVIAPGDSIADITPLNNTLHGEIKIPRKDVGFVEKGQAVKLKFDSYSFSKYGVVNGVISSISRSSYKDDDAEYYIAKIIIDSHYLDKAGSKYYLTPYMEFTADIKTGSRKVIDYALKPVITALDESFDER